MSLRLAFFMLSLKRGTVPEAIENQSSGFPGGACGRISETREDSAS
jgi:hypothetical protein